jgi:hypothetical protein
MYKARVQNDPLKQTTTILSGVECFGHKTNIIHCMIQYNAS